MKHSIAQQTIRELNKHVDRFHRSAGSIFPATGDELLSRASEHIETTGPLQARIEELLDELLHSDTAAFPGLQDLLEKNIIRLSSACRDCETARDKLLEEKNHTGRELANLRKAEKALTSYSESIKHG